MSTGVVLLEQNGKRQEWAHYSKANDHYKIRKRSAKGWIEDKIQPKDFGVLASISQQDMLKITWPPSGLKGSDLKADESFALWSDFLISFDQLLGCNAPYRKVPLGKLREEYKAIKGKGKNDRPPYSVDWVREAWESSVEKMDRYENAIEGWVDDHAKRKALPKSPKKLINVNKTNKFTSWLISKGKLSCGDLDYDYVDREINPVRTTKSEKEDGSKAKGSGGGGIDLLLSNTKGEPVVAEVKVKNDEDSRYALIQALAYASELATTNQMRRLRKWYPKAFDYTTNEMRRLRKLCPKALDSINVLKPRIGILLIFVNREPKDKTREDTLALIREINKLEIDRLGTIVAIENDGDDWKIMT